MRSSGVSSKILLDLNGLSDHLRQQLIFSLALARERILLTILFAFVCICFKGKGLRRYSSVP